MAQDLINRVEWPLLVSLLLSLLLSTLLTNWASSLLRNENRKHVERHRDRSYKLRPSAFANGFFVVPVFVGSALFIWWTILCFYFLEWPPKKGLDSFFTPLTAIGGAIYFLYKAVAGALFGTTSLTLQAEKTDDKTVLLKASIERGDHWLVQIHRAQYKIVVPGTDPDRAQWKNLRFLPPGEKRPLRLAPKETIQCEMKIPFVCGSSEPFIIGRVLSFPVSYPLVSRSYAQAIVLKTDEKTAAVMDSNTFTEVVTAVIDAKFPPPGHPVSK